MRRALLVTGLVLLLTAQTAAVVQNGTSPSEQVGDGRMGITADTGGHSSQSFGGEDGPTFHMTLAPVNTTGTITEDRVSDVARGTRYVELTGHIQAPTPCHTLNTSAAADGNTLTLTVGTTSGDGPCVQQVVMKQYRLDLQADEPFRLELRHGSETVTTLTTTGYPPEEAEEENHGVVAALLRFLNSLF
ncbi:MAG: hypothetical protein SVW77_04035 [Candidatus Nanohaloarchaea archaeon]|nr:hypothetical protein [Candidatus Nanohaloarchaea archaeon]